MQGNTLLIQVPDTDWRVHDVERLTDFAIHQTGFLYCVVFNAQNP